MQAATSTEASKTTIGGLAPAIAKPLYAVVTAALDGICQIGRGFAAIYKDAVFNAEQMVVVYHLELKGAIENSERKLHAVGPPQAVADGLGDSNTPKLVQVCLHKINYATNNCQLVFLIGRTPITKM